MANRPRITRATLGLGLALLHPASAFAWTLPPRAFVDGSIPRAARARRAYAGVVEKVAAMPSDGQATSLVDRTGLQLLNVLWEDTGRWEGSAVGPNISDVTIEVQMEDERGQTRTALMPVMRHANFTDKTGDVPIDKLMIPVGNHDKSGTLSYVSLRDFLAAPTQFMTLPGKGRIKGGSLLAPRDRHALVSAQATFLPVPKQGQATFWPVIFNYQSSRKNPAVLTLLVTRQGTSMTIVDNARDTLGAETWGQRLFFNHEGQRAPLTAERLSDVKQSGQTMNGESAQSVGADANLLMIVQVPLKYRAPIARKSMGIADDFLGNAPAAAPAPAAGKPKAEKHAAASDVEVAVLGHGPELGPYTELDGLTIERDPRFPVRVTVQFYQATSNGALAAADVQGLRAQIDKVYAMADYVGSLVVPTDADRQRPTNWTGVGPRPAGVTVQDFPGLMERWRDGKPMTPLSGAKRAF
ncbi:MAG TPA: hypothetical protein VKQ32_19135 [Polyangia bacterium]|nr:hypothetical protein [Polyangia bacterium]